MAERQAIDLEVRGSNPGPGSNFSLEFKEDVLSYFIHLFSYVKVLPYSFDSVKGVCVCVCELVGTLCRSSK